MMSMHRQVLSDERAWKIRKSGIERGKFHQRRIYTILVTFLRDQASWYGRSLKAVRKYDVINKLYCGGDFADLVATRYEQKSIRSTELL